MSAASVRGGAIWWTLTKERQAWCNLHQVKLCDSDPCLSTLRVGYDIQKWRYIISLPFLEQPTMDKNISHRSMLYFETVQIDCPHQYYMLDHCHFAPRAVCLSAVISQGWARDVNDRDRDETETLAFSFSFPFSFQFQFVTHQTIHNHHVTPSTMLSITLFRHAAWVWKTGTKTKTESGTKNETKTN